MPEEVTEAAGTAESGCPCINIGEHYAYTPYLIGVYPHVC